MIVNYIMNFYKKSTLESVKFDGLYVVKFLQFYKLCFKYVCSNKINSKIMIFYRYLGMSLLKCVMQYGINLKFNLFSTF